jgi:hypothetical protein
MRFRELVETPIGETEPRTATAPDQALRPFYVMIESAAIAARAAAFREEGAPWRCRVKLSRQLTLRWQPSHRRRTDLDMIFGKSRSD